VSEINPRAVIVQANSPITADAPEIVRGKRVLVVEDGPTLTHGEMQYGAGTIAAQRLGAAEIVDPRQYAVKSIAATYEKYPRIGKLLPAMGYGDEQLKDLEATIRRVPCDAVVIGTPIDLRRIITIDQPSTRVRYALEEITSPGLGDILDGFLARHRARRARR
jgi:predicted GTPase